MKRKATTLLVTISILLSLQGFGSDSLYYKSLDFRATGQIDSALVLNLEALENYKLSGNLQGQGECFKNWGVLLSILGDYPEAIEKQRTAIALFGNDSLSVGKCHNNIGAMLLKSGNVDSSLVHLKHAKRLKEKAGIPTESTTNNIAIALSKLKRHDEAIEILREIAPDNRDALNSIGKAFWNIGDLDSSAYYFRLALNASIYSNREIVSRNLRDVFVESGNVDSIAKYISVHESVVDSINAQSTRENAAELEAKYEAEKTRSELLELKLENTNKLIAFFTIIVVIGLFWSIVYRWQRKRIKRQNTIGRAIHLGKKFDDRQLSQSLTESASKIQTSIGQIKSGNLTNEITEYLRSVAIGLERISNSTFPWYVNDQPTLIIAIDAIKNDISSTTHLTFKVNGSEPKDQQHYKDLLEMTEKMIYHYMSASPEKINVCIDTSRSFKIEVEAMTDRCEPSELQASSMAIAQNLGAKVTQSKDEIYLTTKIELND